jgi:lysophospholipase L1-like esterase
VLTRKLLIQAQSYFKEWSPDVIIVYSGINDCKDKYPLKYLINFLPFSIKKNEEINSIIYSKLFSINDLNKLLFKKYIDIFCNIFSNSKIYFNEISCSEKILKRFPSAKKNQAICNDIIGKNKNIFLIYNNQELNKIKGFCEDGFHLNKVGHKLVFKNIYKKIL